MRIDATTRPLVTGASRGIGLELARALASRGAAVGLLARSADEAQARELGPRAVALPADLDRRAVSYPPAVRLLGINGIAPRFADAVVRRLRGGTAAPRRD